MKVVRRVLSLAIIVLSLPLALDYMFFLGPSAPFLAAIVFVVEVFLVTGALALWRYPN
jgi:hypothetical protein